MIIYVFVRIPHCTYPHYIPLNGDIYRWECSGLVGWYPKKVGGQDDPRGKINRSQRPSSIIILITDTDYEGGEDYRIL